jgi:DNA-binding protein H-NS
LKAQAEELMRQAEAARKAETAAAIAEVKAKMAEYGITLAELGGAVKAGKTRKTVAAQYRNSANGETWSGRGRVPRWLAALEGAGHKREEFAVQ